MADQCHSDLKETSQQFGRIYPLIIRPDLNLSRSKICATVARVIVVRTKSSQSPPEKESFGHY
jgi:peptidyl-tRNA hydrolase